MLPLFKLQHSVVWRPCMQDTSQIGGSKIESLVLRSGFQATSGLCFHQLCDSWHIDMLDLMPVVDVMVYCCMRSSVPCVIDHDDHDPSSLKRPARCHLECNQSIQCFTEHRRFQLTVVLQDKDPTSKRTLATPCGLSPNPHFL